MNARSSSNPFTSLSTCSPERFFPSPLSVSRPHASCTYTPSPLARMPRVRLPPIRPGLGVSSPRSPSAEPRLHFPSSSSTSLHSGSGSHSDISTTSTTAPTHLLGGGGGLQRRDRSDGEDARRSALLPNPLAHLDISIGGRDAGRMVFQVTFARNGEERVSNQADERRRHLSPRSL